MTDIERRNGYLYVEYTEEYKLEKFLSISREVLTICRNEQYSKVLVNILNMQGTLSPMQRFEAGVQGARMFRQIKIAVVHRKEEITRFAEDVGVNRGLNGRIFSQMDKALEWLEVEG